MAANVDLINVQNFKDGSKRVETRMIDESPEMGFGKNTVIKTDPSPVVPSSNQFASKETPNPEVSPAD